MNLDNDLRRAFRRQPAPPHLADQVLSRIGQGDVSSPGNIATSPRMSVRRWLAAAAVMTLVVAGGVRYYLHQQTVVEAERVQAEIRLALQITGDKLALVQRKIQGSQR